MRVVRVPRRPRRSFGVPKSSVGVKQHAVEALASLGAAGLDYLTDIAGDPGVPDSIKEQALKAVSSHVSR